MIALATSILVLLFAPVRDGAGPLLTDADIAAYAARPWDKAAMMDRHILLGFHNGGRVVVDFPCGDVCPDYTTRIIHYAVEPARDAAGRAASFATPKFPREPPTFAALSAFPRCWGESQFRSAEVKSAGTAGASYVPSTKTCGS